MSTTNSVRVQLPYHLRTLARMDGDITVEVEDPVTPRTILEALESAYPVLRGTIRDHGTLERRPWLRFFVCNEDISHESPDNPLPDGIASGREPFIVVGAIAGG